MEVLLYYGLICGFQFGMCLVKQKWIRLLPMMIFAFFSAGNGGIWLLSILLGREDTLGFPSALFAVVGAMQFAAAVLGWGIYTFIQYIQKHRNIFVM